MLRRLVWLGALGVVCAATCAQDVATTPLPLGIFGVGFTNVTNTSARLVFTTNEPAAAKVEVFDNTGSVLKADGGAGEIHEAALSGLKTRGEFRVVITARDAKAEAALKLGQRPPSAHQWPGYTIFSSTTQGDSPETMDLLQKTGVKMVRIEPSWDGAFPKRGQLNHAFLDRFVARVKDMKEHGIEPLVILDYSVYWGMTYTHTTMTWRNKNFGPPDDLADWKEYVRTIVTALGAVGAKYYEIWNEPDAGYLATGSFVERPDLPPPIGRPPFKDNIPYWIGDRYVPMVEAARTVIDEIEPGAIVMNGGWNRDYTGGRGDIMFQRGAGPYLDVYAYHVYSHAPVSFARWFQELDTGFRANIDRIFQKNGVSLPLAVTEWGWAAYDQVPEGKGFATLADTQLFYLKSTFYFLSMERFELLSQFSLGVGPRVMKDPNYFMLVNEDDGKLEVTPAYNTFKFLATTFGSKGYRAISVQTGGQPGVKAYGIQMKDSGDLYVAAWQDGDVDDKGAVSPRAARTVPLVIEDAGAKKYRLDVLNVNGQVKSTSEIGAKGDIGINAALPAATSTAESGVFLVRLSGAVGKKR